MPETANGPTRVLLTGPPGSGKTRTLLERFHDERRKGQEDRALLLLPDATAREHIREVLVRLAPKDVPPVFTDKGVHSVFSLVRALGGETSAGPVHRRTLIARWVEEGLLYASAFPIIETSGGQASLGRAVGKLREHGYSAARLSRDAGGLLPQGSILLKALELWEQWLGKTGHRDEQDALTAAVDKAKAESWRIVLIDGFTEIPSLQWKLIEVLVANSELSFAALDPAQPPSSLLAQQLADLGFAERVASDRTRWRNTGALKWLSSVDCWKAEAAAPPEPCPKPSADELVFLEAADPRAEAAALVREAARCVRDGYRYSDIAIIVPHLGRARAVLESEFRRAGIPLRLYIDRPLAQTSPGTLLIGVLSLIEGNWSDANVCALLAHPASGVETGGARKAAIHTGRDERLGTLDSWLEWLGQEDAGFMGGLVNGIAQLAGKSSIDPEEFAGAVIDFLSAPVYESWRSLPEGLLAEEAWAWDRVASFTKSTSRALSETRGELPPARVAEFLRRELLQAKARPLDRRRDCVNAVTLLGARTWSVPVAMVFGLTRENFPHRVSPDPFLPDSLCRALDPPLPTSDEVKEREEALFRVAITRASDRLILSRPLADEDGSPLLPAAPLQKCRELVGEKTSKKLTKKALTDPPLKIKMAVFATDIASGAFDVGVDDAVLIRELSKRCRRPLERAVGDEQYKKAVLEDSGTLIEAACGTEEHPITPTHLNHLAQCPYWFFASRLLRLRDPERYRVAKGLDHLQWGNIAHRALAEWHRTGRKDDLDSLVRSAAAYCLRGIPPTSETEATLRRITDALERFKRFEEQFWPKGFKQKHAELVFDSREPRDDSAREEPMPPIRLEEVGEYTLVLGGRIDRVDVNADDLALVADYKRSGSRNGFQQLLKGRNFQLACYIALVEQRLGLEVVLAFFVFLLKVLEEDFGKVLARSDFADGLKESPFKLTRDKVDPATHLQDARTKLGELIDSLESGEITPIPTDKDTCRRMCPFGDLCRCHPAGDEDVGEEAASD